MAIRLHDFIPILQVAIGPVILGRIVVRSREVGAELRSSHVVALFICCMGSLIGAPVACLRDVNLSLAALKLELNR